MKVIKYFLIGTALTISATGFSQKTKMVTKVCLDSIQEGDKKWSFSYDKRGNNTQSINHSTGVVIDYTYDNRGNNTQSINHSTGIVIEYTYDANGKVTEASYPKKSTKVEYTYDDTENTMLGIWYQRDGNGWIKTGNEDEYTYDNRGNLIKHRSRRNGACNTVTRERHEYKYDAKGNLTEHCRYQGLNEKDEDIRPQEKWEYTYDSNGITGEIYSVHAPTVGWQLGKKYGYTCDCMGNVVKDISYSWFGGEWRYNATGEYEYTYYDLPDSEIEAILPNDKEDYQLKGVVTAKKANYMTTICRYYWSAREIEVESDGGDDVSISEPIKENSSVKIYPNPSTGKLTVKCAETLHATSVQMFDVVGQVVFVSALSSTSPETTIDISHLSAGFYFLKVDGKMFKVVKE